MKNQVKKGEKIYEGKAKILYEGPEEGVLIQYFKDDATAFNNQKKGTIKDKGILNNLISAYLLEGIAELGIPCHFLAKINDREQLVLDADVIPVEVIVRNYAAGGICKLMGIEEGEKILPSLVEFCYKNDELGDPLISSEHIKIFNLAESEEIEIIKEMALRINDYLTGVFRSIGIKLVDFKLEFGRHFNPDAMEEVIILIDEISPDSCRLWDIETNQKLDKDRFRQDLGGVEDAYQEVAKRLGLIGEV